MPKTLLLADDSVTIQKVVGITFANEDVELVTVDNGDDALTRARQVKPDLLLADIGMPGLNGYELCAAIRRDPNLAHIPVLLLTGTFETYDEAKAREVGASGHIAKPFEAQALVDRVFQLLAQAPPKPAVPPPKPAAPPAAAPTVAARPAAAASGTPTAQPRAPVPPPAAPRPRPELPPLPQSRPSAPPPSATATTAVRPAPQPPAAPLPAPPAATPTAPRIAPPLPPKRESTPFEFELPPAAAKPAPGARPAPAAAPPEPVWEAEPEAEVVAEEPAFAPPGADLHRNVSADATRLFAPDLLGRAGQLPEVPEPPHPPRGTRSADFSFDDLDFEEPTPQPAQHSQIFGESSEPAGRPLELDAELAPAPAEAPLEVEALADPLYSQTTFLDPNAAREPAPSLGFDSPGEALAEPEALEIEPTAAAGEESGDEIELAEADTFEDEADSAPEAFAQPFSPDTAAALESPRFERTLPPRMPELPRASEPSARIRPADDAETSSPTLLTPPLRAPRVAPAAAEADTLPPPPRRAPGPSPVAPARASAVVDSTLLAQSVEKVAWEAFGSLSEQVVGEVLKRVEAVVWEVVPQLCERLIREEIARLKAEMSE